MTKTEHRLKCRIDFNRVNKELFDQETLTVYGRNKIAAAKKMALRGDIEIIEAQLIGKRIFQITIKL